MNIKETTDHCETLNPAALSDDEWEVTAAINGKLTPRQTREVLLAMLHRRDGALQAIQKIAAQAIEMTDQRNLLLQAAKGVLPLATMWMNDRPHVPRTKSALECLEAAIARAEQKSEG